MKRAIDIGGAIMGLLFLSPIFLWLGIAIWISMGRPILFRQTRPGLHCKPFAIHKYRTMRMARSDEVWFRSDEARLTRVGRIIRKLSLDELPELWDVLVGAMSLVGPRPLLSEYLGKYSVDQNRRHNMRPGITGWAQINGRQSALFSRRLELDTWYVDNWNNLLDIQILCITACHLIQPTDVIPGQDVEDVDDLGLSSN